MTDEIDFYELGDGRRIAFRHFAGEDGGARDDAPRPTLVFLPGYMSDMAGGKATAIHDWAVARGQPCLLLDYSGCGRSTGDFADGTLSRWCEEVLALVRERVGGPVILIGSSMGGWLMLLAGEALGPRLAGMVGIAAAPDFSDWGYSDSQKAELAAGRTVLEDNPYGPEPTPTHPGFWQDAQRQRLLGREIAIECPVRLLHGQADPDVPWEISLRTAAALRSAEVQVTLVKGGDHRLSREQDIALLLRTLDALPIQ